jgi:preprotein translocase subunit SecG
MTRITTVLGVIFFCIALIFAFLVSRDNTASRFYQAEIEGRAGLLAPGDSADTDLIPDADQDDQGFGTDGAAGDSRL